MVAAEVRNLAERSQGAAQAIGAEAATSVEVAERSGKLLGELVPAIGKTARLVQEVAAAFREQAIGVEQIGRAMASVDHVTQRNASAAEELSSKSEEMASQAEALSRLVGGFRTPAASERWRSSAPRAPAGTGPRPANDVAESGTAAPSRGPVLRA